jgi:hypothetical protein
MMDLYPNVGLTFITVHGVTLFSAKKQGWSWSGSDKYGLHLGNRHNAIER